MKKARFTPWSETRKRILTDPKVKEAYDAMGPEFEVVEQIVKARIERGITQKELARKMRTTQSAISRLESGSANPSLAFLKKLAEALDT